MMLAALRPMNLGEILDRTFEIYRKRFLLFAGIAALPATAMFVVHSVDLVWLHVSSLNEPYRQLGFFLWSSVISLAYYQASEFLWTMALPAYVVASSKAIFGESTSKSTSIWVSLQFIAARWRAYLWIACLAICAEFIIPEMLAVGTMLGTAFVLGKLGLSETGFLLVGAIALLPIAGGLLLSFWVLACIAFAVPAAAVEDLNGIKAFRRSWTLTKGSRGRIIFAWLAVVISSGALSLVVASLLRVLVDTCYYNWHWYWFNMLLYQRARYALSAVIVSCIGPVYPIALTLLYYDQRVRKEGFDVQMLMETAGLEPGAMELAAKSFLPGRIAGFEGGSQSGWSMLVRFIRSLRGFD
jgi:hypothetical protein